MMMYKIRFIENRYVSIRDLSSFLSINGIITYGQKNSFLNFVFKYIEGKRIDVFEKSLRDEFIDYQYFVSKEIYNRMPKRLSIKLLKFDLALFLISERIK